MESPQIAADILRAHGLRRTRGRVRLLRFLLQARTPLSHSEIVAGLGDPPMDRVSVYRNLDALADRGIVHRAYVDGRTYLFETADRCGAMMCHPHFTCRKCGAVSCLTEVKAMLPEGLPDRYVVERTQVHLRGVCPECAGR